MSILYPHKLRSLKNDSLIISIKILEYFKINSVRSVRLGVLLDYAKKKFNTSEKCFVLALNFLYILKKINYDKFEDSVHLL